jgi:hypothetical protein
VILIGASGNDVHSTSSVGQALSRPSAESVADLYQSLRSSTAGATTKTNIDVHYMQPALRPKSLGAVSLMVAG